MATPLEEYTAIGALVFKMASQLKEDMAVTARTDGSYTLAAPAKSGRWDFKTREECLAWLESVDGDPARRRRVTLAKRKELAEARKLRQEEELARIAVEEGELDE